MGPIQTALGQALGSVGAAALVGKKQYERQIAEEKRDAKEEAREAEKAAKADEKAKKEAAKALKAAQKNKIDSPKQVYFLEGEEEPLATSSEIAIVLSTQSLHNALSAKARTKSSIEARRQKVKAKQGA